MRDGTCEGILLRQDALVHKEGGDFEIVCVAPDDPTLSLVASGKAHANQSSVVLEVTWGTNRYILSADLPTE